MSKNIPTLVLHSYSYVRVDFRGDPCIGESSRVPLTVLCKKQHDDLTLNIKEGQPTSDGKQGTVHLDRSYRRTK